MGAIGDRLREMGLELPPRRSAGQYAGAVRSGSLVFVSGAGPVRGAGMVTGKVGGEIDIPAAQEAAKLCALSCLSALQEELGDLDQVTRIVKLLGFVNSAPGFHQQHVLPGKDGRRVRPAAIVVRRKRRARTQLRWRRRAAPQHRCRSGDDR